mgnify:CR=1 FL=1
MEEPSIEELPEKKKCFRCGHVEYMLETQQKDNFLKIGPFSFCSDSCFKVQIEIVERFALLLGQLQPKKKGGVMVLQDIKETTLLYCEFCQRPAKVGKGILKGGFYCGDICYRISTLILVLRKKSSILALEKLFSAPSDSRLLELG